MNDPITAAAWEGASLDRVFASRPRVPNPAARSTANFPAPPNRTINAARRESIQDPNESLAIRLKRCQRPPVNPFRRCVASNSSHPVMATFRGFWIARRFGHRFPKHRKLDFAAPGEIARHDSKHPAAGPADWQRPHRREIRHDKRTTLLLMHRRESRRGDRFCGSAKMFDRSPCKSAGNRRAAFRWNARASRGGLAKVAAEMMAERRFNHGVRDS